jgi:hypothetical protein
MVITDGNTKEVAFFNKAYIATIPDVPKGLAAGIVPWLFHFESVTAQPFTFNQNVVGN